MNKVEEEFGSEDTLLEYGIALRRTIENTQLRDALIFAQRTLDADSPDAKRVLVVIEHALAPIDEVKVPPWDKYYYGELPKPKRLTCVEMDERWKDACVKIAIWRERLEKRTIRATVAFGVVEDIMKTWWFKAFCSPLLKRRIAAWNRDFGRLD